MCISQAALANGLKHAKASGVTVNMAYQDAGVRLTIHDDGIGFDSHTHIQWHKDRSGFGMISMREPAQLPGGKLLVESELGRGTLVNAELPS